MTARSVGVEAELLLVESASGEVLRAAEESDPPPPHGNQGAPADVLDFELKL